MDTRALTLTDFIPVAAVCAFSFVVLIASGGNVLVLLAICALLTGVLVVVYGHHHLPVVYFGATYFILNNPPGIDTGEIVYYAVFTAFLLFSFLPMLATAQFRFENAVDNMVFTFYLVIGFGIVISILFRDPTTSLIGSGAAFSTIVLYFPLRKYLSNEGNRRIFLMTAFLVIFAVVIRNFVNYRQIVIQATMAWELELARTAVNEIVILFGAVLFLVLFSYSKGFKQRILYGILFIAPFLGLLLTQSRGYWLTFIFAVIIIIFLAGKRERVFAISIIAIIGVTGATIAVLFFAEEVQFVLAGLTERFSTLGATSQDLSLMERVAESQTVWEAIKSRPITGYGMGGQYLRYNMILENTYALSNYAHNGYVAIWFKFGIGGLLVVLTLYFTILLKAYQCFKKHPSALYRQISLAIFTVIAVIFILNNTSPIFIMFDGIFFTIVTAAFIGSIYNDIQTTDEGKS
ncbi:MAG: O-antigen ligase family protein [Balneolales bacterium]|nr:O-antigen ligase family protein [Balneolales bacterium]